MSTKGWRSAIWQKLFSVRSDNQYHSEKLQNKDEEEAHELLPSPADLEDGEIDSDFQSPYTDNDKPIKTRKYEVTKAQDPETSEARPPKCASRKASWLAATILIVTLIAGLVLISSMVTRKIPETQTSPSSTASIDEHSSSHPTTQSVPSTSTPTSTAGTRHPILRHSWTELSPIQKHSYIAALQCLRTLPPLLPHMPTNASAYSDYPYVHAHIGYRTHNAASFLPWHRYFLSLYEDRLRESCGYDGGIPYWDWSADADTDPKSDLSGSSVFSISDGFGGNGDTTGPVTVGQHGRCITSGPFAGLQVLWYDVKYQPHCLSRGFRTDSTSQADPNGKARIDGSALTTVEINKILDLDSYESFVSALEKKVHDVIPFGVGGDFETFSAPFEPLFWLHHAQLDRLWSIWQRRKSSEQAQDKGNDERRLYEYGGHKFRHSIERAGLDDLIEMGGVLGQDVSVRKVMDLRGGCGGVGSTAEGENGSGILCVGYT